MRALELAPNDLMRSRTVALFYLRDDELSEALKAYRRALEIDPLHLNVRLNIQVAQGGGASLALSHDERWSAQYRL